MPVSVTKNVKSEDEIKQIVSNAFPEKRLSNISELKDGFFNVAYEVDFAEGEKMILKIAPLPEIEVMSYEKNIMYTEVEGMKIVSKYTEVPVAKVLYYDNSHTICDSDYFFMEYLSGKSFESCGDIFSNEEKYRIVKQIGECTRQINSIEGKMFGYFGQADRQDTNWYKVFREMIELAFFDADRKQINTKVKQKKVLELLDRDKDIFNEVTIPQLVHWDIWAGNILINEKEISGIIDFERCLWGDKLMEVGFRTYGYDKAFFDGYGIQELSVTEKIRTLWYDIYLLLLMSLETEYRSYGHPGIYDWSTQMLMKAIAKVEEENI